MIHRISISEIFDKALQYQRESKQKGFATGGCVGIETNFCEQVKRSKKSIEAEAELIEDAIIDNEILGYQVEVDKTIKDDTIIMTDGINSVTAKVIDAHSVVENSKCKY